MGRLLHHPVGPYFVFCDVYRRGAGGRAAVQQRQAAQAVVFCARRRLLCGERHGLLLSVSVGFAQPQHRAVDLCLPGHVRHDRLLRMAVQRLRPARCALLCRKRCGGVQRGQTDLRLHRGDHYLRGHPYPAVRRGVQRHLHRAGGGGVCALVLAAEKAEPDKFVRRAAAPASPYVGDPRRFGHLQYPVRKVHLRLFAAGRHHRRHQAHSAAVLPAGFDDQFRRVHHQPPAARDGDHLAAEQKAARAVRLFKGEYRRAEHQISRSEGDDRLAAQDGGSKHRRAPARGRGADRRLRQDRQNGQHLFRRAAHRAQHLLRAKRHQIHLPCRRRGALVHAADGRRLLFR